MHGCVLIGLSASRPRWFVGWCVPVGYVEHIPFLNAVWCFGCIEMDWLACDCVQLFGFLIFDPVGLRGPVSYTHLTLPTNREV